MLHISKEQLIDTAKDMIQRLESREIDLADTVATMASSVYSCPARFEEEKAKLFKRIPLMLAASCELPDIGSYKAIEVVGVPVLLVRDTKDSVKAFVNSCTHRGSQLATGCGHAKKFTCPYHGWTFSADGKLLTVASGRVFGEVNKDKLGLISLPALESAGLIWVVPDPQSEVTIDSFLHGIDHMLEGFNLKSWKFHEQRLLEGANWKLAFDAHMDFYHLPILHKETFGPTISNLAQYYFQGPHQRLGLMSENSVEQDSLQTLKSIPPNEWPLEPMLFGEWIIFPNVSLNCFKAGERIMVISQVLPGDTPESSITIQTFLTEKPTNDDTLPQVQELVEFIGKVVGEEDLAMSRKQQAALSSGLIPEVLFGRNEYGLQEYYRWLGGCLSAHDDQELNMLFKNGGHIS